MREAADPRREEYAREMHHFEPVTILITDDDDGHADLIREHLEDAGVGNSFLRFRDGQEILDFLFQPDSQTGIDKPGNYLLLLDIRMPRVDGVEVLRRIKSDQHLHTMPVIMLTTTDDPREIEKCYELGCNCYVTKPVDFTMFAETLKRLGLFILVLRTPPSEKAD